MEHALAAHYPYYLANRPVQSASTLEVTDKYTHQAVTRVSLANEAAVQQAIALAAAAVGPMRSLPTYARQQVLSHCVRRFKEREQELAYGLCVEAGKPIRDARLEVSRLIDTFNLAAEESTRVYGEIIPLDTVPRTHGYVGLSKRVPVGVCAMITPFNFPLNLVAHKVAPAIAMGCPFILKPSELTPVGALMIAEVLAETDLPPGAFSVLPLDVKDASALVHDERIKLLSFTGSTKVGWQLKAQAGKKKVLLELGGNAAVIVDRDADIDDAVARIVFGAFYQSGQSCVSVQRVFCHQTLYEAFKHKLLEKTRMLKVGDPKMEDTFVGPMISDKEATRLHQWIQNAVQAGAKLLCGGNRQGNIITPAVFEGVPVHEPLVAQEAFGPVLMLEPFDDFTEALQRVNQSDYGLQAGVFTRDLYKAHQAWDTLDVGGVIIGDVPSWRADNMPYGGVKHSGFGREGVRFAMQEMSELRMLGIRTP